MALVTKCRFLLTIATIGLALGCTQSSFSGNSKQSPSDAPDKPLQNDQDSTANVQGAAPAATAKPVIAPPTSQAAIQSPTVPSSTTPPGKIVVPANCGSGGATQATVISPSVQNSNPNSNIQYSIFLTDCAGKPIPFSASKITFSCDAEIVSNQPPALNYTVSDATNKISGQMAFVPDSQGDGGEVNETDQAVTFASNDTTITFTMFFGGITMQPSDGSPNRLTCDLAFGAAAPITTTVPLTN